MKTGVRMPPGHALRAWILAVAASQTTPVEAASQRHRVTATFGPDGCVSLSRTREGFCRISTDCEGKDISKFEFAFDCKNGGPPGNATRIVRHSFGVGGFDVDEDFRTGIKCKECLAPSAAVMYTATPKAQPQVLPAVPAAAALAAHVVSSATEVLSYGPGGCVSARKSDVGHCIIETKCKDEDIENYEMGFVCAEKSGSQVRHAYGRGAMKAIEAFDTSVACERCLPFDSPGPVVMAASHPVPGAIARYGPNGCVSTFLGDDGKHCMMQTQCAAADIADYEFGLLCEDGQGTSVRHLFGKHSFDPVETFNTLIVCSKCLPLDTDAALPGASPDAARILALETHVKALDAQVAGLSGAVARISSAVFGAALPGAPAPAPIAAAAAPVALGSWGSQRLSRNERTEKYVYEDDVPARRHAAYRLAGARRQRRRPYMRGSVRASRAEAAEEDEDEEEEQQLQGEEQDEAAPSRRDAPAPIAEAEDVEEDVVPANYVEEPRWRARAPRRQRLQQARSEAADVERSYSDLREVPGQPVALDAGQAEEDSVGDGSAAYGSDLD